MVAIIYSNTLTNKGTKCLTSQTPKTAQNSSVGGVVSIRLSSTSNYNSFIYQSLQLVLSDSASQASL